MSKVECLKTNPDQFDRLVKFVRDKGSTPSRDTSSDVPAISKPKPPQNNLVIVPPTTFRSIDPFYISLLVNGFKLSNCVIDSDTSNNVMPTKVATALGLNLTKTFGCCFSMENKQVPLIG